jgi:glutamine amidotransferase
VCRLAAHVGPPAPLSSLLYDPPHALEEQAHSPRELLHGTVNVDGTGVAWWPTRDRPPLRYVTERTPWADPNLPELARRLEGTPIVAAVRSATPGIPLGTDAVAPFTADGLAFAHNGWLGGFGDGVRGRLEDRVDPAVHHATRAASDSLVLFGLVRTHLRAGSGLAEAVTTALTDAADACRAADRRATLNVVVSDGARVVATRCSVGLAGNSLYTHTGPHAWRLASEPLDPDEDWEPVPDGSLLVAGTEGVDRCDLAP